VFSTTEPKLKKATPDDVKVLMTNATHLGVGEIVELYSLRWQIELFFKELKSTLGFHQYKFKNFAAVEGWVQLAVITFLYLEWYRMQQLQNRKLAAAETRWWRCQRLHGICQAVRLKTQEGDIKFLTERLETSGGIKKLKRLLRKKLAA
jgi:hypothetical protein